MPRKVIYLLKQMYIRFIYSFVYSFLGTDAVTDLDVAAAQFANKKELISSPNSKWVQAGFPDENPDEKLIRELEEKLKSEYPEVK